MVSDNRVIVFLGSYGLCSVEKEDHFWAWINDRRFINVGYRNPSSAYVSVALYFLSFGG
jgi:hypothetical protein